MLAKCRPGIDVRSIVFTDEKFFRLEQDDRKQRMWLDSGTTKKVTLIQSHASLSVVCTLIFSSSVAPVEDSVSDQVISVSLEACRVRFANFF